eukprot:TRINITY_DN23246_c0_g1_i1.p1 TRINITY_DN23246_c0_g1~~TRINITY_DN23246_c0_g1_i1.p1  ORF type:complete len:140 (+),score=26.46 TRINITY_DN23246_c0_g1_i1:59-421(+)
MCIRDRKSMNDYASGLFALKCNVKGLNDNLAAAGKGVNGSIFDQIDAKFYKMEAKEDRSRENYRESVVTRGTASSKMLGGPSTGANRASSTMSMAGSSLLRSTHTRGLEGGSKGGFSRPK